MQKSAPLLVSGIFAIALAIIPHARAQDSSEVLSYTVEHPTYGNIGTYINTVTKDGKMADVRTDLHVAVKVIGIRMFHQDATREERWDNQQLVSFKSSTDDNGTQINVTGQADRNGFHINSTAAGVVTAPPQVHPSNPWAPFILHTDVEMSTKTGRVVPVVVKDTGLMTMSFDGRPIQVHQWFIDGDKHEVVWIDARGVVVGFQTTEQDTAINFILKTQTAAAGPTPSPSLAHN